MGIQNLKTNRLSDRRPSKKPGISTGSGLGEEKKSGNFSPVFSPFSSGHF
jgi:hypothetical protein